MPDDAHLSRRGLMAAGAALTGAALGATPAHAAESIDSGRVEGGRVTFPNWRGAADRPSPPPPAPLPPGERVGFAIVGLGRLTLEQILPAFGECRRARAVALVSGTPDKARLVAGQHGIPADAVYDYAGFDRIAENPAIQAVYIVLPNGMHREYVLRAAAARKHVLCEKPMANDSAQARDMIKACADAGVRLMIAYRCQYEPYNREVIRLARSGEVGATRLIQAVNVQSMGDGEQWRFKRVLSGGGALPDIGLYCLNAARYVTGEEPASVTAEIQNPSGDPRYRDVEQTVTFGLRFPSGVLAQCATSYGAHEAKSLRVNAEGAAIDLENAFAYEGQRLLVGHRGAGKAESQEVLALPRQNQFAREIDHMATCVSEGRRPRTPGEEGLQDHLVMEAIYEAARTGGRVALKPDPAATGPDGAGRRDATRGPEPEDAG